LETGGRKQKSTTAEETPTCSRRTFERMRIIVVAKIGMTSFLGHEL